MKRGFKKTQQLKQFEPITFWAEGENDESWEKVRGEVEQQFANYRAPKSIEKELSVVEANLKVTTDELEVLKRFPKENADKIARGKFEISLLKGLLKDLKRSDN